MSAAPPGLSPVWAPGQVYEQENCCDQKFVLSDAQSHLCPQLRFEQKLALTMQSETFYAYPRCGDSSGYSVASQQSGLLGRQTRDDVPGQAAFLHLLNRGEIPVLCRSTNGAVMSSIYFVGAGRSFNVTQGRPSLKDCYGRAMHLKIDEDLQRKPYVVKKINPQPSHLVSDQVQLKSITNEVRILANETLKQTPQIVRLICVAWDETPTMGRHWPQLLIESANYGTFAEFLARHEESRNWDVKLSLLLDVLAGLSILHRHEIAHCDVKLENVLIFQPGTEEVDQGIRKPKYRAKLCDFGFSVIMSDYEKDSAFSTILGTEPWNAPELTFGTPIETQQLPRADIYSFGLLFSRVLLHGGNPFASLRREEIWHLKQDTDNRALFEKIKSSIFGQVEYSEHKQLLIRRTLHRTLAHSPEMRIPLHMLGRQLLILDALCPLYVTIGGNGA